MSGIHAHLRRDLLSGVLPRDVALVPGELAERYGVSRTPAREALHLLAQEGLLASVRRGFVVVQRSDEEVLEVFEARAVLDAAAAAGAATRSSAVDLAALTRTQDACELAVAALEGTDAPQTAPVRDGLRRFHAELRTAAHNATISGFLDQCDAKITLSAPWHPTPAPPALATAVAEHAAVLVAVRDRQPERARVLMLEHHARDRDLRLAELLERRTAV